MVLDALEKGEQPIPAKITSMYEDPDEQSLVSSLFMTEIVELEKAEEKEKAIAEILYKLKERTFRRHEETRGADIRDIEQGIAEKKALQEIKRIRIRL